MNQHDSSGFSFCFRGFVAWWNHWANGLAWWVNAPAWRLGLRQGGFWSWWILYLSFSPLDFDFHQILRASLVSPVKANDLPKLRAAAVDEVVLKAARDRKNTNYSELLRSTRCRLVITATKANSKPSTCVTARGAHRAEFSSLFKKHSFYFREDLKSLQAVQQFITNFCNEWLVEQNLKFYAIE